MNNLEEVIKTLREQGVNEGKKEAERIIDEAHKKAGIIIEEADKKAKEKIKEAEKVIKEKELSAKSAVEISAKNIIHSTTVKIADMLDRVLKENVKKGLLQEEVIKKIIRGEKVSLQEILPMLREKAVSDGFEIEYENGKIMIKWKEGNFHYEISEDIIVEGLKNGIREELHGFIFPPTL